MKEIKTFFGKDNKLNKGYARIPNIRENDNVFYQKKFAHILPPVDLITEFENIHPGTLAKLIDMAEREQHHRQALDLVNLDSQARAFKTGRYFALMFMIVACITTIALVVIASAYIGIMFATIAFVAISAIALFPVKKSFKKFEPINSISATKTSTSGEQGVVRNHHTARRKIRR